MERVLATIQERGSQELKRELEPIREAIASFQGVTVAQALTRAQTMTPAEKGSVMSVVKPRDFAPASREADWNLLREKANHAEKSQEGKEEPAR